MTWPTNLPNSAAFDADADSVAASRPELKKMSDAVNTMASNVYTAGSTTGTITPDVANGEIQRITLTGNITMNAFANPVAGQRLTMIFKQPAAGSTFDLTSNMLWENGTESLTQINGAVDTAEIFYDGTNYYARMNLAHGSVEVYAISVNPLQEDLDVNNFKIVNNVTNGNIVLQPNGTGDVQLNADTVRVGDSNSLATVSSNGTGSLLLTTNNGGTGAEQFIQIANGENGKITIQTDLIAGGGSGGMINLRSFRTVLGAVGGYGSTAIITTEEDSAGYSPSIFISPGEVKPGGFLSGSQLPRIELKSIGDIDIIAGNDPGGNSINFGYSLIKNLTLQNYFEKVHNLGNQTGNLPFIDAQNGNIQRMRLTGNVTFRGFFGQGDGQTITLIIQQDGTGNRTFTEGLDSANRMLFAGGVSTLSTGANAVDIMTISYIDGTYYGSINKGYV
jgi:hypothetical protein